MTSDGSGLSMLGSRIGAFVGFELTGQRLRVSICTSHTEQAGHGGIQFVNRKSRRVIRLSHSLP